MNDRNTTPMSLAQKILTVAIWTILAASVFCLGLIAHGQQTIAPFFTSQENTNLIVKMGTGSPYTTIHLATVKACTSPAAFTVILLPGANPTDTVSGQTGVCAGATLIDYTAAPAVTYKGNGTGYVTQGSGGGGPPTGAAGGDLNGSNYPNPQLSAIKAVPFCAGFAPTNGQAVIYTTGGSPNPCYGASSVSASVTLTGDVTGSGTGSIVTTLERIAGVPLCAGFSPTNGQALQYTTASSPSPCYTAGAGVNFSNYGGVNVMGDSIPASTGSVNYGLQGSLSTGYGPDLIADFGGNGNNYAYGGDQAADMSEKVYANLNPSLANNFVTTFGISTNDVNVYGTNTDKQNIFTRALQGAIAWAATPDISKFYVKDTNFCTRAGTWANDGGGPRGGLIYSVTNASSLSCPITVPAGSSAIYYGYAACDGYAGGTALITIDGVSPGTDATVSSAGQGGAAIATANGLTCTYMVARYPTTAGAHTFLITTSGGGVVEPMWLGSPMPADASVSAPPLVLVGGTPWNQNNSPASTTAAYNTIIANTVATMAGDGAPVFFVDIRNGTNTRNANTTAPLNSDHDYNGGVEGNITCPVSTLLPFHPNSTPYWSRACGHGHLAANFEAAIGIKAGGPSPSPAVSGPTLAPRGYSVAGNGTGNYGYGYSANGDMRIGSMAGFSYGAPGDPNLHIALPTTGGCFSLDIGNSPAPGVTPTIVTPLLICPDGLRSPSNTAIRFVNPATPPLSTGQRVATFLSPNLGVAGSSSDVTVGVEDTDLNNAVFGFNFYGLADPRNSMWFGVQNGAGTVPGFCASADGSLGFGYSLNQLCPNTGGGVSYHNMSTSGSIGGFPLTVGTCATATFTVIGATVGHPVSISASDGSLPDPLVTLSAAVSSTNLVSIQECAIATVTPAAKTYNVVAF